MPGRADCFIDLVFLSPVGVLKMLKLPQGLHRMCLVFLSPLLTKQVLLVLQNSIIDTYCWGL